MDENLKKVAKLLDDNKCTQISMLDVHGLTYIADYFVIATVANKPHAEAVCRKLEEYFDSLGEKDGYFHTEGRETGQWVLCDTGDMIIHLFQAETRKFYNLDALWGDAKQIDVEALLAGN
jgi:ribosome-associated protein